MLLCFSSPRFLKLFSIDPNCLECLNSTLPCSTGPDQINQQITLPIVARNQRERFYERFPYFTNTETNGHLPKSWVGTHRQKFGTLQGAHSHQDITLEKNGTYRTKR